MLSMELAPPLHSPSQDHTNHIHDIHSCIAFTLRTRSAALKDQSKLSIQVKAETINKNTNTFASLLQACTNVRQLGQFHAHMLLTGLNQNIKVVTTLVRMYAMLGNMDTARLVFEKIYRRDVFLWNTMIGEYARSGLYEEALGLYYEMQAAGIEPDKFTFRFVLTACAGLSALQEGKEIHDHIIQSGFKSDVFVWTALINMYAKCGSTDIACYLFDKMPERNVVSWNAMISGYAQNGQADEALNLFHEMQLADIKPISVTMVSVLSACAHLGALQEGKWIHNCIIIRGFASDTFVGTALVDMYSKCGDIETARRVFDRMSKRNVVSWNAMVAGYSRNGNGTEALALFNQMQLEGVKPNLVTVVCVVPAYAHLEALQQVKCIQSYIIKSGFESDIFVTNSLLAIYAKCGRVELAHQLFVEMSKLHVTSWNTMIAGFSQNGYGSEALALFNQMQLVDLKPDSLTMVSVLPACAHLTTLQQGKSIHGYIIKSGFESDVVLQTALIDMYAKCRSIEIARQVFVKMPKRNVVSWNAMIDGYVQEGHANEGLMLFNQMLLTDMKPDSAIIVSVLPACAHLTTLQEVKWIHGYIIRIGFESDVVIQTSLIDMYAKCNSIEIAHRLFDKMPQRNVVSWNAMIGVFFQNGHPNEALTLFNQMISTNIKPDSTTMVSILQVCADLGALQQGKCIHDYIIKNGFESDVFVGNSLIAMYANCGSVDNAYQLFHKMSKRDVVSWTMMIAGYSQSGYANEALKLFNQMQVTGIKPDSITIVKVLPTCVQLATLQQGECIHGYAIRSGFESDIFVGNALLDMYAKCRSIEDARKVFNKMLEQNVVSWNAMIAGYAQNGYVEEALKLFEKMPKRDLISWNVMITGYAQNGYVDEAFNLFKKMPKQNVVSWNAMIAGYAQNGHFAEALTFFRQMKLTGVKPNTVTFASVLSVCANLAALQEGKKVHDDITSSGLQSDVFVGCALVDMYAKCGSIGDARDVFENLPERTVVSWNALIIGYAMHGCGKECLQLFEQMQHSGIMPNHVTFVGVLSACCHAGLVDDGLQYFDRMAQEYHITPALEHCCCLVDLLGRAGRLDDALDFINKMPIKPDAAVWGSLLGACRTHGNVDLGECVAERLFELESDNSANYVLLSNIYGAAGKWDDKEKVRKMMKDKRVKKTPGRSWIEVNNKVYTFLVGDRSHPQTQKIYAELERLFGQMKEAGYVSDTNFVLHDVEEEQKEHILSHHSEKLAVAFGLINTSPGTPIRVVKNLRVCGDCHSVIKFISKIVARDIVLRDANRFHHFKDGQCSCRDYW